MRRLATVVGFAARGTWGVSFVENRADSAAGGFELLRVSGGNVRGNTVIGCRRGGIEASSGGDTGIEANVLLGGPVGIRVTTENGAAKPGHGYRIDDNMLSGVEQGVVLGGVTDSRVRGNVFDGVGTGLVVDGTGHGTEVSGNVFLRATGWFIDAPDLVAGGNYWATADASAAAPRRCAAGSASCPGGLRARRATSEHLRGQGVKVAKVERLARAGHGAVGKGSAGSDWPE